MILDILNATNTAHYPVLRKKSEDVTEFNQEIQDLCRDLTETMFAMNGFGLAAPQIGRNLNVFVMRTAEGIEKDNQEVRVVINPHTVFQVGEDQSTPKEQIEGCLSLPGILGRVERFHEIGCVYWGVDGKRAGEALKGFEARIYQHERDHLAGILFIDRATRFYTHTNAVKTIPGPKPKTAHSY